MWLQSTIERGAAGAQRSDAIAGIEADAAKLPVVAAVAHKAGGAIYTSLDEALVTVEKVMDLRQADELDAAAIEQAEASLGERMDSLRASLERLSPEAHAVAAWREGGMVGARRFASGQWLVVRATNGAWREAAAEEACSLAGGPVSLHPWNHAPLEVSLDAFEALRAWHTIALRAQHSHIADALSGRRLDVLQQCVAIEVAGGGRS